MQIVFFYGSIPVVWVEGVPVNGGLTQKGDVLSLKNRAEIYGHIWDIKIYTLKIQIGFLDS